MSGIKVKPLDYSPKTPMKERLERQRYDNWVESEKTLALLKDREAEKKRLKQQQNQPVKSFLKI
ncbi:hypothetical protein [Vibrio quintilis]|uniref:Uncharacterized protein n=1 Tax=Vibrio quintilis TaxID=1117707 RepID=A0A1M7Z222_9VIBR|nr:hypothetical protein [Vibrio quintilis]SHO58943.1 hypothetical protein VQ7734_04718 [Vibrio quintilis]